MVWPSQPKKRRDGGNVVAEMTLILAAMATMLFVLSAGLVRQHFGSSPYGLAPLTNLTKRKTELWFLKYAGVWISVFAVIVGSGCYERFSAETYLFVCGGLAAPLYLQPFAYPALTSEANLPLFKRHSFRANLWLAIFGFAGNYWYTHYFYSVLGAAYTMPSYRLNGVPIPMFFATHFYFCFYHALSNCLLRYIDNFRPSPGRLAFKAAAVAAFAYLTAFLETLTIASFPYWTFKDRRKVYTLGSAFYSIYFVVSFPAYYYLDEAAPNVVLDPRNRSGDLLPVVRGALAASFLVLCLLDFVRLALGIPLHIRISNFHTP